MLIMDNVYYIDNLYQEWEKDPSSVDAAWDAYFRDVKRTIVSLPQKATQVGECETAYKQSRVDSMLWAYRDIGYLYACLNPLGGNFGPDRNYLHRDCAVAHERCAGRTRSASPWWNSRSRAPRRRNGRRRLIASITP